MTSDRDPAAAADLETRRLQMSIDDNVLTSWVAENCLGGVAPERNYAVVFLERTFARWAERQS